MAGKGDVMGYCRRGRREGEVPRVQMGSSGAGQLTFTLGNPHWPNPSVPRGWSAGQWMGGRGSWEACLGDGIHFPVATMCEMKIG